MNITKQNSIAIYADGADIEAMRQMAKLPEVTGFTTNPTLMKRAGITNYLAFAQKVVAEFPDMPVSFEVFAQDQADQLISMACSEDSGIGQRFRCFCLPVWNFG